MIKRPSHTSKLLCVLTLSLFTGWGNVTPANPAAPQTDKAEAPQCKRTLEQAPELRGLKLGMSLQQVSKLYPGATTKFSAAGMRNKVYGLEEREISRDAEHGASASRLADVHAIELDFIDGRLYRMRIYYDKSISWDDVEEFALRVSGGLNLPSAWANSDIGGGDRRHLHCGAFSLTASTEEPGKSWSAILTMFDPVASKSARERVDKGLTKQPLEAEEKEKRRKVFRP
jgi:hypothetical protein